MSMSIVDVELHNADSIHAGIGKSHCLWFLFGRVLTKEVDIQYDSAPTSEELVGLICSGVYVIV